MAEGVITAKGVENTMMIVSNGEVYRLLEFAEEDRDSSDPWYTNDFDTAYEDIESGCTIFLKYLFNKNFI